VKPGARRGTGRKGGMDAVARKKKLTGMVWRAAGETVAFSLLLAGGMLYFLRSYGYLNAFPGWIRFITMCAAAIVIAVAAGAAFGSWQAGRTTRRLRALEEAMIHLEKGSPAAKVEPMGDDEIGRLADRLALIRRKWEDQVTSLQRLSAHNAELANRARFTAVMEERQRLARELHDAVSQQLFAISMTATALSRTLDRDLEKARHQIILIEEMASVAQSEMRALLLHLRPVHLEGRRLTDGLRDLVRELQAKVPIEIATDFDEDLALPMGFEDHLFRIAQEALSNTLRHAKASRLSLSLKKHGETIHLSIRDNGVGFDLGVQKQASYGLKSMQERVSELGGAIQIVSAPGKGTRIDIRIPILDAEGEGPSTDDKADQSAAGG